MATTITLNGTSYSVPGVSDSYGTSLSNYLIALSTGVLSKAGGTFTLTGEANFGATYGLKSAYYKSQATNPGSTGILRLGNNESIVWRNQANSANLTLTAYTSNRLQYSGVDVPTISSTDTLTNKTIDSSSNTLSNIANASISASAAIALSKIAGGTAGYIPFASSATALSNDSNLFWDNTNKRLGIGGTPSYQCHVYHPTSSIIFLGGDSTTNMYINRASTDASAPDIFFRKSRGNSASPTTVTSSDVLGRILFQAYGGSNFRNIAYIQGVVDTYTSDTDISSRLSFYTTPTGSVTASERMRIDPSGNIGIGTTPSTRLHVSGTTNLRFETSADNYGFEGYSSTTHIFSLTRTTNDTRLSTYGSFILKTNAITGPTSGTEAMIIDSSQRVGIGVTPSSRNNTTLQIKDGIGFPATQVSSTDPNTLDDYEEGSWTPSVTANSGSFTTVSATGDYTKIGRLVTAHVTITITTNGTAASTVNFSLPFTSASGHEYYGCGRERNSTGVSLSVAVSASSSTAVIRKYDNSYPGGSGYILETTVSYYV